MINTWMIRAGEGGFAVNDFIDKNVAAIGWGNIGKIAKGVSRTEIVKLLKDEYPDDKDGKIRMWASQIDRFINEVEKGDFVITYESGRRIYHYGVIDSEAKFDSNVIEDLPRYRVVKWAVQISRDVLSAGAKNTLGGISTLYLINPEVALELKTFADNPNKKLIEEVAENESIEDESIDTFDSIKNRSIELIKDKLIKLSADDMELLVAGILRAMGYKAKVSPKGRDRGIDVIASKDGFGFEPPRIVAEVKHRPNSSMGAQEIRSFLGGRHKDDKGLYVSTGGFTQDAKYEADRANIPMKLMDLNGLVEAIIEYYEDFDNETKMLVPLMKVYWTIA